MPATEKLSADAKAIIDTKLTGDDARVMRSAFRHGGVAWGTRPACHRRLEALGLVSQARDSEHGNNTAFLTPLGKAVRNALPE